MDQFRHSTGRLRADPDDIVSISPSSRHLAQAHVQAASGRNDESGGWATALECSFAGRCR